jgi:hypothetical protein
MEAVEALCRGRNRGICFAFCCPLARMISEIVGSV